MENNEYITGYGDAVVDYKGKPHDAHGANLYRLKSTGYSSARYGVCEVCGLHCAEVYMQVRVKGNDRFGHEDCLVKSRVRS